jgi:hypothetical protein
LKGFGTRFNKPRFAFYGAIVLFGFFSIARLSHHNGFDDIPFLCSHEHAKKIILFVEKN